ncbi:MAG: aldehyde ferredoxin oxidoreductase family protein, partial [Myxococcales bacterium]
YLEVDLSSGGMSTRAIPAEVVELYIGGRGLGARLLYDLTPPGLDPFDERMPIIFSIGPLNGSSAPQSNRFVVTTKSPATGAIADSHCGGSFATKLKKAGFDGVIVRGRSPRPVYLEIKDGKAEIKDAAHLWGKGTVATQAALPASFGKAVIGPAGENRVPFACIVSQNRIAGRAGTGAVMGSKNLKAIIADGSATTFERDEAFKALQKEVTEYLRAHPMTGQILPTLGTANLVMTCAGRNIIPTRNFQKGRDRRTPELAGERMRDELLIKKDGCMACPVKCGRHIRLRKGEGKGPEFETIGLLGNNLGIFDMQIVAELGELCDDLGMDTISMGGVLGFATELTERGMLQSDLAWGRVEAYREAIEATARRTGLGAELADGTRALARRRGGEEFAIQVKGLELPAYDPRGCFGQGLEYATNNRGGCHIRGSTMFLEATGPVSINPLSTAGKPELVVFQQDMNAAVSSLVFCYFASYAVLPATMFKLEPNSFAYRIAMATASRATGPALRLAMRAKTSAQILWFEKFLSLAWGRRVGIGELMQVGARVFNLERLYNLREGLTASADTLPRRLLDEPTFPGVKAGVPLAEMLGRYYRIRGWDSNGVPTLATLRSLAIRS